VARISWLDISENSLVSETEPSVGIRKTEKKLMTDEFSLLINAHFDSVPGSPGAADDGIGE